MRIPLLTGLLLVSAWTTHAQSSSSSIPQEAQNPGATTATTTATPTMTTSLVTSTSADVFSFHDLPSGANELIYYANLTPDPGVDIDTLVPFHGMIQLYIRKDDGDSFVDSSVDTVSDTSANSSYMGLTNTDTKPRITLNLATVLSQDQDGHAFFLALQISKSDVAGLSSSQTFYSPLFGVLHNITSDTSVFKGEDLSGATPATPTFSPASSTGSSGTASNYALNTDTASAGSKSSSSGLATGAIAGIAVGGAVVLIIIIAVIWFIIRNRKRARSHPADATTPLAAGYGRVAAAVGSRDLIAEKEAGAMVAESPQTQTYADHFDPRHSATLSGAAVTSSSVAPPTNAIYPERDHQAYDDVGRSLTDLQPPHGSASSGRGLDSPVPDAGVTRHLVDDDMTADEIARLEEEERELDRQIQEAGRRRR